MATSRAGSFLTGLLVFTTVCLLPDSARAQSSSDFFDDKVLQQITLTVDPNDWATMLKNYQDSSYYHAQLSWGTLTLNVGIKNHGSGSRSPIKPNVTVNISKYVKGQTFLGLSSFILKANNEDASNLHEWLAFKFFRKMGIPAPREAPAQLAVNGQYFGFYMAVEHMDEQFLIRNYGEDSGYFYEWNYLGLPHYNFEILDNGNPSAYGPYLELQTDQDAPDLQNFANLVNAINNSFDDTLAANVSPYLDPQFYLQYAAVENLLADKDGVWSDYQGMNNFYLYQFANRTLYTLAPWDKDQTFSDANRSVEQGASTNLLANRLLAMPRFAQLYSNKVAQAAEAFGGPGGWADRQLTEEYNVIAAAARNDPRQQCLVLNPTSGTCPPHAFQDEVNNMRRFIAARQNILLHQSAQLGSQPTEGAPKLTDINASESGSNLLTSGSMATIYGVDLGTGAETYVTVDGERAPISSHTATQIVLQIPADLAAGPASVVVSADGTLSRPFETYLFPASKGTGLAASLSSLSFTNQNPASWSAFQPITLTNETDQPLTISSVAIDGQNPNDFLQYNNCVSVVEPKSICSVSVGFNPQLLGTRRAALTIAGTGFTQSIPLVGSSSVSDGVFEIVNSRTGKALDVPMANTANGVAVQQYALNGNQQQQWQLLSVGNGFYEIVNKGTGKVLDVRGDASDNGIVIQQYDYLGTPNQHWQLDPADGAHYRIVSRSTGKVLDVTAASSADGVPIQQYDYLANGQQLWTLVPAQRHTIINDLSGKALDLMDEGSTNGILLSQDTLSVSAYGQWQFVPVNDGYYAIVNDGSGKVVDVKGLSMHNAAALQQYDYLQGANQQWRLVPIDNSRFIFVNRLSGKVMDLPQDSALGDTHLQQWDLLNGFNQFWQIRTDAVQP